MVIRIDPGVVRVWRSPHSVQFGVDTALAVVNDLDAAKERVLDALAVGTGVEGLRAVGSQYGLTHRQVDEVRRAVSAVLIDSPEPTRPPRARVAVAGGTPTASEVARLLTAAGVTVTRHSELGSLTTTRTDLGVAVGHFVLHPELHSVWLRRDIPHLPIVWGDAEVRIGPLVEPGHGPCLHCLQRHRADADPAWPVIASQLLDRTSSLETPIRVAEVAALAARAVLARLDGGPGHASATRINAGGERSTESFERHPECGCHDLANLLALPGRRETASRPRARQGTSTPRGVRAASRATTTRAGADAPA